MQLPSTPPRIFRPTAMTEAKRSSGGRYAGASDVPLYPVLSSAAASVITGTALVATRDVVMQASGLSVAMLRYVIAAACLLPLVPLFHTFDVGRRDLGPIAALGALYFGLFPWCISAAMQYTTASQGAIVLASTPALTLLLARLMGMEQLSAGKSFGVIFAILGAATAFGSVPGVQLGAGAWRGNSLMLVAALSGAAYAVFSKPYLAKYPPLTVTAVAMAAGAIALCAIWAFVELPAGLPRLDGRGWLEILYIGAIGGALSFFLYAWALGRTTATVTMIVLPLNPITAMLTDALVLSERMTAELFAGLLLVIIGIVLVVGLPGNAAPEARELETRRS